MSKWKLIMLGEEYFFDTEEEAEDHALYLKGCARQGAETLHWSNPGDWDYNEDTFEEPDYEIIEIED